MKISGKTLWLVCIATFVIGAGILWVLEDPYVKSQYYETDATVTVELQWPDDAEYCRVCDKLVYNRPFAFIFKHKPSSRDWAWSPIYPVTHWRTGELVNSTKVRVSDIKRPATLIIWVRYYGDVVENYNGIELEMSVVLDTVKHEYLITPMSK